MKILAIDDEPIALEGLKKSISAVLPEAEIQAFSLPSEALKWIKENKVDIVFSDIQMQGMTGVDLAKKIKQYHKTANIIFCTGYDNFLKEAFDLYASGYLMKPITKKKVQEAVQNLRFPIEEEQKKVKARCFGDFEVFFEGKPIRFKHSKTKELFAYLVDRCGTSCSLGMAAATLFEDDGHEAYIYKLRNDLVATLEELGCIDILVKSYGKIGIIMDAIECDYYDCLNGKDKEYKNYHGEYMNQYSWAEYTLATIENLLDRI